MYNISFHFVFNGKTFKRFYFNAIDYDVDFNYSFVSVTDKEGYKVTFPISEIVFLCVEEVKDA